MARMRDKVTGATGEYMALPIVSFRAFCRYFPGHGEARTLWTILLLTFEDYKLQGRISISQLEQMTGLSSRCVLECLQNLEVQNMITVKREAGQINTIRFQKDPEKWVVNKKSVAYLERKLKIRDKYRQIVIKKIEADLDEPTEE